MAGLVCKYAVCLVSQWVVGIDGQRPATQIEPTNQINAQRHQRQSDPDLLRQALRVVRLHEEFQQRKLEGAKSKLQGCVAG